MKIKIGYHENSQGIITGYIYIDKYGIMYYSRVYSEFHMENEEVIKDSFVLAKYKTKQIKMLWNIP